MRIDFTSSERSTLGIEWELALTDRTRSRDLFDVWFFLARLGYSMEQFAAEVARMKRNYPFDTVSKD